MVLIQTWKQSLEMEQAEKPWYSSIHPWANIRWSILRSLGSQMVRRGIDEVVLSLSLVELSLEPLVELSPVVLHGSFSGQTLVIHLPLIQIVELEAIPSAYCSWYSMIANIKTTEDKMATKEIFIVSFFPTNIKTNAEL